MLSVFKCYLLGKVFSDYLIERSTLATFHPFIFHIYVSPILDGRFHKAGILVFSHC